jgi:hypothetical protein
MSWIADDGSLYTGKASIARMQQLVAVRSAVSPAGAGLLAEPD